MEVVAAIGLDIATSVFQLHGIAVLVARPHLFAICELLCPHASRA
jgi:hypothetical protein